MSHIDGRIIGRFRASAPYQVTLPMSQTACPKPTDFESIDSILFALHEVISGPRNVPRDWDRFQSLFAPDARLTRVVHDEPRPGDSSLQAFAPGSFVAFFESEIRTDDFYERETSRRVEQFGRIAHTFSTYESRRSEDGPTFQRGINSIQLFRDDSGWRFVSILWDCERPESPIPERYLSAKSASTPGGIDAP